MVEAVWCGRTARECILRMNERARGGCSRRPNGRGAGKKPFLEVIRNADLPRDIFRSGRTAGDVFRRELAAVHPARTLRVTAVPLRLTRRGKPGLGTGRRRRSNQSGGARLEHVRTEVPSPNVSSPTSCDTAASRRSRGTWEDAG
jgi:hypothetical protein